METKTSIKANSQEQIKKVADIVDAIYRFNSVGGNCHIVIDDYNIDDGSIDWCLKHGLSSNVHKHPEKHLKIEKEFLEAFRELSISNREKVLNI